MGSPPCFTGWALRTQCSGLGSSGGNYRACLVPSYLPPTPVPAPLLPPPNSLKSHCSLCSSQHITDALKTLRVDPPNKESGTKSRGKKYAKAAPWPSSLLWQCPDLIATGEKLRGDDEAYLVCPAALGPSLDGDNAFAQTPDSWSFLGTSGSGRENVANRGRSILLTLAEAN